RAPSPRIAGMNTCKRCPAIATVLRWCSSCAADVADERVGAFVKRRDGACVVCGVTRELTWAHIYSRRYRRIRWLPSNTVAMCWPDHQYLDTHPNEKRAFFRTNYPGLMDKLDKLKDRAPLPDLAQIIRTYSPERSQA
ncbi:MAG: hypothetical protein M3P18_06990, partial [Actinomycetota bacterium]|nr:hypothetical protein [Actinomycetota bacterium]